jgi:formiminotetrahydrofolate cyclodeaminase
MTGTPKLADLPLTEFVHRLAERTPTPGGGSVAAQLAAEGAALTEMAFRFTSGEKFAAVEGEMARRVEELEGLRSRSLELIDRDSRAYDEVTRAYRMPKAIDTEKAARRMAVQRALGNALDVPFETLETALAALRLSAEGAPDVNPNLASDCTTGALCLWSAVEAAFANVRINAALLEDKQRAAERLSAGEALRRDAHQLLADVRKALDRKP